MAVTVKRAKGKVAARGRRHLRVRKKISGTAARPRLVVSRSARARLRPGRGRHPGRTLASASTMEADVRALDGDKTAKARKVGELLADRAKSAGVDVRRVRPRRQQVPRPGRGDRRRRPRGGSGAVMPTIALEANSVVAEKRNV